MNNYITLGEIDFKKSIQPMKVDEKESLQRLLSREVFLAREELNRYQEFLKFAKTKKNDLECHKNEQRIKDTELFLEQLGRKLFICQKEIESTKTVKYIESANVSKRHDLSDCLSANSLNDINDESLNSSSQSTKSLISNFEKYNATSSDNTRQLKTAQNSTNLNKKPITNTQSPLPRNSLKSNIKVEETAPVLFKDIKLKKVGLPPDAKEVVNQSSVQENRDLSRDQYDKYKQIPISNGIHSFPKSSSIDLGTPSPVKTKDKFRNQNKEIQIAIQNELKDLKLKKTNNNVLNPVINCSVDEMGLGRFNFVNEQSASNSNCSTVARMSASKSMPFLNSISTLNTSSDTRDSNLISVPTEIGKFEHEENNCNSCESSSIGSWDPTVMLKQLYDSDKQLNELQLPVKKNSKNTSGFIEMLPGLSNNSGNAALWKRKFATIANGELKIFENQTSRSALNVFEIKNISIKSINNVTIELYDLKGIHSTIRFSKLSECDQWIDSIKSHSSYKTSEIVPCLYDSISQYSTSKILIMDIGSCSIRAGLLKFEPTLPKLYFPNIAAITRKTNNVYEIGFEAFNSSINDECNIIRPFKPDTTIEDIAFTTGTVEFTFRKTCSLLNINPEDYVIMLSLPHNVAEATRTKLADVLLLRLNFRGVSMCGQSLLALHAYGEHTGVLVDMGHRTEILPVIHGIVQNSAANRSLYGGHLIQIALSHLLPFESLSLIDFLLVRYIMEKACFVAENSDKSQNCNENMNLNLDNFQLPSQIPKSLSLKGRDRCLPVEGLFNPEIYFLETLSLPKLIMKSIQSCPVDNRRDLCQSICLSGASSQLSGFRDRLERELKLLSPGNCDVKVRCSPNRTHYSYVGACFVALSEGFNRTIVNRMEWEESRTISLRKWNF